jgi:hypothetical protein
MTTTYPVKLSITLKPIWHQYPPRVRIGLDQNLTEIDVQDTTTINFEVESNHSITLTVELLNKHDSDTVPEQGLDKAVIIESVSFFGIADPQFIWAGEYRPCYPEPWYSEQTVKPAPLLKNHTYLCWNGKWTLTFEVPVFTWIHQIQDLGWIYD